MTTEATRPLASGPAQRSMRASERASEHRTATGSLPSIPLERPGPGPGPRPGPPASLSQAHRQAAACKPRARACAGRREAQRPNDACVHPPASVSISGQRPTGCGLRATARPARPARQPASTPARQRSSDRPTQLKRPQATATDASARSVLPAHVGRRRRAAIGPLRPAATCCAVAVVPHLSALHSACTSWPQGDGAPGRPGPVLDITTGSRGSCAPPLFSSCAQAQARAQAQAQAQARAAQEPAGTVAPAHQDTGRVSFGQHWAVPGQDSISKVELSAGPQAAVLCALATGVLTQSDNVIHGSW